MTSSEDNVRDALIAAQRENDQKSLFESDDMPKNWQLMWNDMPEFNMGNTEPVQKIVVSFASFEDVAAFATLIGRRIGTKTNSIWYPEQQNYVAPKNYRYTDES